MGKTGRNLQAEAIIEIMLKKGLIEDTGDKTYRITPKGRAYSRHLAERHDANLAEERSVSAWADAEMGIDQSYRD